MFRKITSNRDPHVTLTSELKKEFGYLFMRMSAYAGAMLQKYPRHIFVWMLTCILVSGTLSFSVMRVNAPPALPLNFPAGQGIGPGMEDIIGKGRAIKTLLGLHQSVDTILHKSKLEHTDSIALKQAVKQLDSIQHQIHHSYDH